MGLIADLLIPPQWRIKTAASLTDFSSPGELPSLCTLSVWFDDGMGYEHVHIQRAYANVSVRINGVIADEYAGNPSAIGGSHADLLKIALTRRYGGFAGTYAELYCVHQLVDAEAFGKGTGASWRPVEAVLPNVVWDRSGTAYASSNFAANYWPAQAFNGKYGDGWCAATVPSVNSPVILAYDYGAAKQVNNYTLFGWGNNTARTPSDWNVQGSNNSTNGMDGTWTTLDTRSGEDPTYGIHYSITSPSPYRWCRLRITKALGGQACGVKELLLFVEDGTDLHGSHLDFANPDALGEDVSGNDNHWTVQGTPSINRP
ncbi:hypothetical protein GKC30_06405 [Pseudodesulfovibrio sp. F-1]|uniref:F5/8 type C domain-containing protein n=1 Tax=Pseudodesulfovibrio alkaliphilus TaxID=2661613 RepID=A0A7K1KME5_9BACT|nr:discoidin domain-containing protein [Pseudodesulfovibrio alkaliphilus]MUM77258.1 hypothetical protein [Pseudodesulfovibrio alkaliphilus]